MPAIAGDRIAFFDKGPFSFSSDAVINDLSIGLNDCCREGGITTSCTGSVAVSDLALVDQIYVEKSKLPTSGLTGWEFALSGGGFDGTYSIEVAGADQVIDGKLYRTLKVDPNLPSIDLSSADGVVIDMFYIWDNLTITSKDTECCCVHISDIETNIEAIWCDDSKLQRAKSPVIYDSVNDAILLLDGTIPLITLGSVFFNICNTGIDGQYRRSFGSTAGAFTYLGDSYTEIEVTPAIISPDLTNAVDLGSGKYWWPEICITWYQAPEAAHLCIEVVVPAGLDQGGHYKMVLYNKATNQVLKNYESFKIVTDHTAECHTLSVQYRHSFNINGYKYKLKPGFYQEARFYIENLYSYNDRKLKNQALPSGQTITIGGSKVRKTAFQSTIQDQCGHDKIDFIVDHDSIVIENKEYTGTEGYENGLDSLELVSNGRFELTEKNSTVSLNLC